MGVIVSVTIRLGILARTVVRERRGTTTTEVPTHPVDAEIQGTSGAHACAAANSSQISSMAQDVFDLDGAVEGHIRMVAVH